MPVDFDLADKAGQDAFGEKISILPVASQPGEPAYDARAIFDEPYREIDDEFDVPVASSKPTASIREVEYGVAPKAGDRLTRAKTGRSYLILEPQSDGDGETLLPLQSIIS